VPIRSLWEESITCGQAVAKSTRYTASINFMQFAFRWQSYSSSFCMNKIVCRYCDLLIAKSFQCMYFFREN
jgi:hypothetical protein